jgi:hypothetical protein
MAMPAAPASAASTVSSSAVNSPWRLSVMYRLPNTSPRTRTGTPRKEVIGGWSRGNPADAGCWRRSATRSGCGSVINCPRTPLPSGRGPIRACSSSSIPTVMKSDRPPVAPSTPTAPYRASTRSAAACAMRHSVPRRSSPVATDRNASSKPCTRSWLRATACNRSCTSPPSSVSRIPGRSEPCSSSCRDLPADDSRVMRSTLTRPDSECGPFRHPEGHRPTGDARLLWHVLGRSSPWPRCGQAPLWPHGEPRRRVRTRPTTEVSAISSTAPQASAAAGVLVLIPNWIAAQAAGDSAQASTSTSISSATSASSSSCPFPGCRSGSAGM